MALHLSYKNEDIKSILTFLNTSAVGFYSGKLSFDDHNYSMSIKSALLAALNDIEGSIMGRFNCDMFLRGINSNNKILKQMFPTGCGVFSGMDIGAVLCGLRNVNAHARVSEEDLSLLNSNFFFRRLDLLPKMTDGIFYLTKNSTLTMAGVIASVMLFLRAQSIEVLCKKSRVFCIVAAGTTTINDGVSFVQNISHVNLELPIREKAGNTLLSALFGEYENRLSNNDSELTLEFGTSKNPTYQLRVFVDEINQTIDVKKHSLSKVFYETDYELQIPDIDSFIRLSNEFPPFVLVDLLYKLGIKRFDGATAALIDKNMSRYSKLNYPKYYIDKNLDILIMPPTKADFRIISSTLTDALIEIFLRFEEEIYKVYGFEQEGYSKVSKAFSTIGLSDALARDLLTIRNMSMHGYILDEYEKYYDAISQYSLTFIIDTLRKLLTELKELNNDVFAYVQKDIDERLVKRIVGVRYKQIIEYSMDAFVGHIKFNPNDPKVKNKQVFVDSSFFNIEEFNNLYLEKPTPLIAKYIIEGEKEPYYVYTNNQKQIAALSTYLNTKGRSYSVTEEEKGIIKYVTLKISDK